MRAGRLRHSIIFMSKSSTQDSYGDESSELVQVKPAKVNVQVISATEMLKSGVNLNSKTISVLARYDADIKDDMWIRWEGEDFNIKGNRPDDRKRQMTILATKE